MNEACVLAMELSTSCGSVAVLRGEKVLYHATFQAQRSHNAQLFGPLGEALQVAGDELNGMVVGLGPGSYTGVRIGIAAAQGMALQRGVPVWGLSSFWGLEWQAPFAVLGNARRGRWYVARLKGDSLLPEVTIFKPEEALSQVEAEPETRWLTCDGTEASPLVVSVQVDASHLALKTCQWLKGGRLAASDNAASVLEPLYLEEAFITKAKPRNAEG